MSPKIWCPETLSPTQIIFPSAWYVHYWNRFYTMSNSSQMDEKKRNLLVMDSQMSDLSKQGLVGDGYLCSTDTVSTSLTFTRRAISWSALSESTPHIFQWFPSHRQFPPATDSTCKCSCILVLILLLVAQFMVSNMKRKVLVYVHVWQRKYHLYIECWFCGEAAVKTHGPDHWPHKTL